MKVQDLFEGMIFNIKDEDTDTVTQGKIIDIWSMRAGNAWGIQFDDKYETFTWGNDEDELPSSFEYVGQYNPNQDRR